MQTANLRCVDRKQLRMTPDSMLKPGWLPPELCPRGHHGDHNMAVLSVVRLEYHQISLTKLPNMTVESRSRIGRSQSGRRPGGNVCLPQKPKRREVRAKTRLTPRPPSLTERLAWIH